MKKMKENTNLNMAKSHQNIDLKEYKTPELTNYGGISELVQAILFNGGDGGALNNSAST